MTTPIRIGFFLPHSGNFNRVFEALTANPTFGEKPGFEGVKVSGDHYHVYSKHWTFQPWEPRAAPPWNGEGAPPAGIQVEIHNPIGRGIAENAESFIGRKATVLSTFTNMHGYKMVAVENAEGTCICFIADMCRPIRTAEQIAAEERRRVIEEMVYGAAGCERDGQNTKAFLICGFLYDAGYRKVEQ